MKPMLMDDVRLYKEKDGFVRYYAENPRGKTFELTENLYREVKKADGRTKLDIQPDVLNLLIEAEIVRTTRWIKESENTYRFTAFPLKKSGKAHPLCRFFSFTLPFLTVVSAVFLLAPVKVGKDFDFLLCCVLAYTSYIIHEAGHLLTGWGLPTPIRWSEIGLTFETKKRLRWLKRLSGFYVAHDDQEKSLVSRKENIRVFLSGIELQLVFSAALKLCGMSFAHMFSGTFDVVSRIIAIGIFQNLLPTQQGTDGEQLLNMAFGVESIRDECACRIHSRQWRVKATNQGVGGWLALGLCSVVHYSNFMFCVFFLGELLCIVMR